MSKVTVIVTVLNEEKTIVRLLTALLEQTTPPTEVIITDGGSKDRTVELIQNFGAEHPRFPLKVIYQKGNRSIGRNKAIELSRTELIAITDAGCVPHKEWLAELLVAYQTAVKNPKQNSTNEIVVAGYYDAIATTDLQRAIVPYVLVMPDQIDPDHFLPATRSMLLTKTLWQSLGGFDLDLNDNEDYAFAHKILRSNKQIIFAEKARVSWLPPERLEHFCRMIFRFARGDVYAGILRKRVVALFGRYLVGVVTVGLLWWLFSPVFSFGFVVVGLSIYLCWAVAKNARYVGKAWYWLPILQLTADGAVMWGSLVGGFNRLFAQ